MGRFFDTNVFVYAFLDQDDGKKEVAARLIAEGIADGDSFVSPQVVKEFCNVMLKKSKRPVRDIASALSIFDEFRVAEDNIDLIRNGLAIKGKYGTQFYDSVILAQAESSGCDIIYSEDLNDGQVYGKVTARNPFA